MFSKEEFRIHSVVPAMQPECYTEDYQQPHEHRMAQFQESRRIRKSDKNFKTERKKVLKSPCVGKEYSAKMDPSAEMKAITCLSAEDDEGDIEYKWKLTGVADQRLQHLITQMQFRVSEGCGQCLYQLGVTDDGVPEGLSREDVQESLQTIKKMADALGFATTVLKSCPVEEGSDLYCVEILISRRLHARLLDLGIVFCGPVANGKSTLLGVLLTSDLDDGRGFTRQLLFNHKHEINTGKTSSLATRLWPVTKESPRCSDNDAGSCLSPSTCPSSSNSRNLEGVDLSPETEICAYDSPFTSKLESSNSSNNEYSNSQPQPCKCVVVGESGASPQANCRWINLIDTGGGIGKTMLFALMSRSPDYVCLCIAGDNPLEEIELHIKLCITLEVRFVVVITKIDLLEEFDLDNYAMEISVLLQQNGAKNILFETKEDVAAFHSKDCALKSEFDEPQKDTLSPSTTERDTELLVPIISCSSVTGKGLDIVRLFLAGLHRQKISLPSPIATCTPSFEVLLDKTIKVDGIGDVLCGIVSSGQVNVGNECFIGPLDEGGTFSRLKIISIHVEGSHVDSARRGEEATFAFAEFPSEIHSSLKGAIMTDTVLPKVCYSFSLEVQVLRGSLTCGMEPILYTRNTRQAVSVLSCASVENNSKSSFNVTTTLQLACRFLFRPQIMGEGSRAVLKWSNGLAAGKVLSSVTPQKESVIKK